MLAPLLAALALAADPGSPASSAEPVTAEPGVEETVRGYLGAIDRPVPEEAWRQLGPAGEAELERIARSTGAFAVRRARALEGLAAFGGARAEAVHLELSRAPDAPRLVRSAAVRGLGRLLPAARAARELRPVLEQDSDRGVRATAAEVLSRRAPAESCAAIRAQAARDGARSGLFARALAATTFFLPEQA